MAPPLLGPPKLRKPKPIVKEITAAAGSDPFMDLMVANFNDEQASSPPSPPKGYTKNHSSTYLSSSNPCLDFFFRVVPNTRPELIKQKLHAAWNHNSLITLKLIANLRGVRGTGKSDKEGFYTAAFWLHQLHPKTLACNVPVLAQFGYFKDLPEILYRLLEGADVRERQKQEWKNRKNEKDTKIPPPFFKKKQPKKGRKGGPNSTREIRVMNARQRDLIEKQNASILKKEKKLAMAKKAFNIYSHDPDFKFLYDCVSDFFAECLLEDMKHMQSGDVRKVGLAAKWCPSIDSSFDKATLICESIARKVFPREKYPEYDGIEEAHYVYRVRDRLRKDVLVPLRKALELPEVYIGANRWDVLPYNRVASVAMKFYKDKFLKHDPERFTKYLEDVKAGKAKIAAGALLPHEIIVALNDDDGGQVAELQWKRMVNDLLEKGKLKNCLAISDVSGSMAGTPMEVSVALGALISELSEEPWKGKLITFSAEPKLQAVQGSNLREKTQFVRGMEWGMNTDFQKVFDLILKVAVEGKLIPDQMIKRVFVFSDMEFDKASSNPWESDYKVIMKKFTDKGYGDAIPEIVFWNLRESMATPVSAVQKGVALVSGFSKNLMKLFLNADGVISPESVMETAISGEEYQKLVVID